MGRLRAAALATVALALTATPPGAAERPGAERTLLLVWNDPEAILPTGAFADVAREVDTILGGAGIEVKWGPPGRVHPIGSRHIHVIAVGHERLGRNDPGVLGATHRQPLEVAALWVVLPNLRRLLAGGGNAGRATWVPASRLARALARVVVHEIVHVVAPDVAHARSGLMQPSLRPDELLASRLDLDPESSRIVREALQRPRFTSAGRGAGAGGPD